MRHKSLLIPRNKKIASIFHDIKLMENWGTGFFRIISTCKENNNKVIFEEKTGAFVITIIKSVVLSDHEKLGENRKKIMICIERNPQVTISELSSAVGISATAIEKNLDFLKEHGFLTRVGPDKGGHWEILN